MSDIRMKSLNIIIYRRNVYKSFIYVCVGGVTVTPPLEIFSHYYTNENYDVILEFPPGMPMPMSRDDVLFETPELYDLGLKEVYKLVDICINKNINFNVSLDGLNVYGRYAAYKKFEFINKDIIEYLGKLENIIFYPKDYDDIYVHLSKLDINSGITFIGLEFYNVSKLMMHYYSGRYEIYKNLLAGRVIVLISDLYRIDNSVIAETGIMSLVLLDKNFYYDSSISVDQKFFIMFGASKSIIEKKAIGITEDTEKSFELLSETLNSSLNIDHINSD